MFFLLLKARKWLIEILNAVIIKILFLYFNHREKCEKKNWSWFNSIWEIENYELSNKIKYPKDLAVLKI